MSQISFSKLAPYALKGLISIESPLGKQLMGHKVGDRLTIEVNNDYSYDITILKIEKMMYTSYIRV